MGYPWHWEQIPPYLPLFITALGRTLLISLWSIIFGTALGLVIGVMRVQRKGVFASASLAYVEVMRNIPLMLVIFLTYFGVGYIYPMSGLWASIISLSIFEAAYIAEIVRAGIQSIEKGQLEASRSLGMSYFQSLRFVVLPQAVRRIIPPLTGQFVSLIKDSSLASLVSYQELMLVGRQINSRIFRPFEVFLTIGVLYFSICFLLSLLSRYEERRLAISE
ncbi:MAG: amino acid ABC transporter permease [Candidatus Eisenbacteria bacterium]|nr:amino acid ABC transporter permease [Candidatus Eisenbacteria bacterium]